MNNYHYLMPTYITKSSFTIEKAKTLTSLFTVLDDRRNTDELDVTVDDITEDDVDIILDPLVPSGSTDDFWISPCVIFSVTKKYLFTTYTSICI